MIGAMLRTKAMLILLGAILSVPAESVYADLNDPMDFYQATNGGNCATCRWIAAEGIIQRDTADQFLAFLRSEDLLDVPSLNVHLNSPGGNLIGGMRLGDAIRRQNLNTVVATATIERALNGGIQMVRADPSHRAVCASACVFAFAGGVSRFASKETPPNQIGFQLIGELGVHQFYDPISTRDRAALSASGEDRIRDQRTVALLLAFLSDMRVSAELLQLASQTDPSDMHFLTEEELRRTKIDNRMVRTVFLSGYHNGVAVAEIVYGRRDADYRLELYCDDSAIQLKATIDWRGPYDIAGHRGWRLLERMSLANGGEVELVSERFVYRADGAVSGEFLFRFSDSPTHLVARRDFTFLDFSSRYASNAADEISFALPSDFDGLHLLPRTCL